MTFLRNAWYVAAWAGEITEQPLARRLLGERVVLFRTAGGAPVALTDRCPHRFAPLSRGKVNGEIIECAYHGLQFDARGHCVRNQMGNGHIPQKALVRSYASVQRFQMIWIWMGDARRADAKLIPDYGGILPDEPGGHDNLGNYLHVKANYLLEIDNLMDLSHVNFLHDGSLGNETMRSYQVRVTEGENKIRADLWMPGTRASFGELSGQPCDQWQNMIWMSPTSMLLEFGQVRPGMPRIQKPDEYAIHIVTPETDRTTHYFYGTSGSYPADEAWKAEAMREAQRTAFTRDDSPMIEAIDEVMGGADLWSLHPVLLRGDSAAVHVRRRLESLAREEAERHADEDARAFAAARPAGQGDATEYVDA
jgi:phenylpropionate dioxygenase-like ring-hydroxylating dioxygenase large terminal subunit